VPPAASDDSSSSSGSSVRRARMVPPEAWKQKAVRRTFAREARLRQSGPPLLLTI
jgi:hypothetical protein